MANNKEIKIRVGIAGEKEFNAALHEAQRNLKTLKSELKAETAELGANATAQQKNEARAKSLKAQIAEQEKVVDTLKKALAEAKKDYGDNEDVVQKWEQKLNEARTTLANMQNGLADTENAMRGVSGATAEGVTATKSFADALSSVASVGESVSGAIEDIFTGLISTVGDVIVDLWDMIGETAAKANNWTDIAGYWNTDPANVQKWESAVRSTHNEFADFEAMISRFALGGKEKQIAEMLGVSDVNYTSQWDYAVACMREISKMTKDGSLPDNFWEEIFGERKATKAMDIINDWDEIEKQLANYDAENGGYGITNEQIEQLSKQREDIDRLYEKFTALKREFAAGLAPVFADIGVKIEGGLDALHEFFNAENDEERQAAIDKLKANLKEFFEKIAAAIRDAFQILEDTADSLRKSDDPLVSTIGSILKGIADALQWITENATRVKVALASVFGFWLLFKLAAIGHKLGAIVAQIAVIRGFKNFSLEEKSVEKVAEKAAETAAEAGGATASGGFWATLGSSAAPVVGGLAGGTLLSGLVWGPLMKALYEKNYEETWGEYNANEDINEERREQVEKTNNAEAERLQALLDEMLWAVSGDEDMGLGADMAAAIKDAFRENANEYIAIAPDSDFWEWAGQFADTSDGLDAQEIENIINGIYLGDAWQEFGIDAANAMAARIDEIMMGNEQAKGQSGITSEDVGVFKGIPGAVERGAEAGTQRAIKNLKIIMDGEVVARIVSQAIARDVT